MAKFKTVAGLIDAVEKQGVTDVVLEFPDDIKNDFLKNAAEINAL